MKMGFRERSCEDAEWIKAVFSGKLWYLLSEKQLISRDCK